MQKQIIFIHGGGSPEDFQADEKLAVSLRKELGPGYSVHYPFLPNDGTPDLGRRKQIAHEIDVSEDGVILVAHSLGASMLLACLSEAEIAKNIGGIFLLATPFWQGDEDWVKAFELKPGFAGNMDRKTPLFFYHCLDDEEVPVAQVTHYKHHLPWATFREIAQGGHQFDNNVAIVAEDIKSM
ncbi:alpha/beta hydrolase [Dyadobacter sp. LJ53]|uniref:alpha/beta fold hydrolase n=1 Tax=Dyadobacter chenwenxiniae TaxID=2906456 RepID=UPI001F48035C|nr:alpha/beta fold hydrolase [Dyadobacter chenwenxiniae]MCF0048599.1 alpha/beta hydrolase [Dyadobacter chenwenxiniae]